ncbi:NADPH-dependent FMN reductase [Streptomyces celluloflavus]|uniref:NADPH-dependent FMN reductase n=1 Tax=Streptomyces celluloflavus TaxID=58344 RepID=A0ABW7RQX0_9ACTN
MTRLLILTGSIRTRSYSCSLARFAAQQIAERDATPLLWDHRKRPLPFADPEYHKRPAANPDPAVRELVQLADVTNAFVLASPVYHNSYSGLLKNALDHLTMEQFRGKPVVLLGHGPRLTAIQAVDHLRTVVRGLYGLALPDQAVTTPEDYGTDEEGEPYLKEEGQRARVTGVVSVLLKAAGHRTGDCG